MVITSKRCYHTQQKAILFWAFLASSVTAFHISRPIDHAAILESSRAWSTPRNAQHDISSSWNTRRKSSTQQLLASQNDNSIESSSTSHTLSDLTVAVVGGGPSGLLLAHGLLQAGATVKLYEKRSRPGKLELEKRAYALGVGLRGRTAVQSVDQNYHNNNKGTTTTTTTTTTPLWDAIKARGYGSERFILHVGPLSIRLRDENDSDEGIKLEPSLLMFQSDLCRSLADELEHRWQSSGRLQMKFDCGVSAIDFTTKTLVSDESSEREAFDLIVGCDGVNSVVRKAMTDTWKGSFEATQELIPGMFKVVKLPAMPPTIDPSAVQLLFPKKGSVTAFVEPTAKGRCCLLFAGRDKDDILLSGSNVTAVEEALEERYPKLAGVDLKLVAEQLVEYPKASQASLVRCNTFHASSVAALIGDAAHATGGVSGQGVNSALQDAALLTKCLSEYYTGEETSLQKALLMYSQKAVPEAKALYDLSFGPSNISPLTRFKLTGKTIIDSIFKGKWGIGERPLNTLLTTSTKTFSQIRKDRDEFYEAEFQSEEYWKQTLMELDSKIGTPAKSSQNVNV